MGPLFMDRVRETSTTTGTGTLTLAGAVAGYRPFSVIGDTNQVYYCIVMGTDWEVGQGTYTASGATLSRDRVLASSNAGALVNFGVGTKDVFAQNPAAYIAAPRKNAIINGDFDIWQRNTSFAAIATATYSADQWLYGKNGAVVHTVSRSTTVPTVAQSGKLSNYSLLIDCTTVDSSIAAADYAFIGQKIEGYNWKNFAQKTITLSFWVRSTKTGIFCVAVRNSGSDRSCVVEYTVNTTNTWEKKTVTFPASPSAGTWDYTTGLGLDVTFCLACGTTYQTTADAWQTGNYLATSNQVNACDSTSNDFYLSQVQLEVGDTATDFEIRDFATELAMCQRYYCKTFDIDQAPVQALGLTSACVIGAIASGTANIAYWSFPVEMRTIPTITTYNPTQAATSWRNAANTDNSTVGVSSVGTRGATLSGLDSLDQHFYLIHATANAEL